MAPYRPWPQLFLLITNQFIFSFIFAGIRHPEELSFCKPLEPSHLKCNLKDLKNNKKHGEHLHNGHSPADTNTFIANGNHNGSTNSLDKNSPGYICAPVTPVKQNSTPIGTPIGVGILNISVFKNKNLFLESPGLFYLFIFFSFFRRPTRGGGINLPSFIRII